MSDLADRLPMLVMGKQHGELLNKTVYRTRAGQVEAVPGGYGITLLKSGGGYSQCSLLLNDLSGNEAELDFGSLTGALRAIDNVVVNSYATDGAYRDVKDNPAWKQMYRIGTYNLTRLDAGGVLTTAPLPACPCYNCGFITPMATIEVDHHKPLSGGGDQAIMKVFRHLGMTNLPGRGKLATLNNAAIRAGKPAFGGLAVPMNPKNNVMGVWNPSGIVDAGLQDRYSLDMYGMLVLSIAIGTSTLEDIRKRCLHSYVNLKPMCSACNGNKSDKIKVIP